MAEEDQSCPSKYSVNQHSIMRNLLSGGKLVSASSTERLESLLGMTSQPQFDEVSVIASGSGLGGGVQSSHPPAEQSQLLAQGTDAKMSQELGQHQEQKQEQKQEQQQPQLLLSLLNRRQEPELQQNQPRQGTHSDGDNPESSQSNSFRIPFFAPLPPLPQRKKVPNDTFICRLGQGCVDDVYSIAFEIFHCLREIPLPNGSAQMAKIAHERKIQLQDKLRIQKMKFRQLRRVFDKCNENCQTQGMEYVDIESLVPMKDSYDSKSENKNMSAADLRAIEEKEYLIEQVVLRNRELKDIIYHLRRLVFEINVMLDTRKS